MRKSKSRKILIQEATSYNSSSYGYKWTEKHFEELYPTVPHFESSSQTFNITLIYQSNNINLKVPAGITTKALPYLFHQGIYKFLLNKQDTNPLYKTSLVVGF